MTAYLRTVVNVVYFYLAWLSRYRRRMFFGIDDILVIISSRIRPRGRLDLENVELLLFALCSNRGSGIAILNFGLLAPFPGFNFLTFYFVFFTTYRSI